MENLPYLMKDSKNFSKIFRKDMDYDHISQGFTLSLDDIFL